MRGRKFNAVFIDRLLYWQIRDQRFTGRVHSIFDQAINVEFDGLGLVTVISPRKYNGPAFIKACPFSSLKGMLRVRSRAVLTGEELVFPSPGVRIPLDGARPWSGKTKINRFAGNDELAAKVSVFQEVIVSHRDGREAVEQRIDKLENSILSGEPLQIKRALDTIIGLGDGLTPAGDDVLLGLLCFISSVPSEIRGEHFNKFLETFSLMLEDHINSTTFISYSLLKYGLEGRFVEPLSDLCVAILSDGGDGLGKNLERLLGVGASSGINMLKGVVLGVDLYLAPKG
ncbi:MAG: DUF2877 domain-containing protein [Candidatus Tritonobacter lacicola]|nr:DUF2877 domain-containing protein [Candidatus Tritonobacter lacicola]